MRDSALPRRPARRTPVTIPFLLVAALGLATAAAASDPARWIRRANEALLPGDTFRAHATIATHDGFGHDRQISLDWLHRSPDGAAETLLEVTAPEDAAGAVYRISRRGDDHVTRTAYLPAFDRAVRVQGVARTDHFLGTEFTYEDVGLLAPEERGQGSVARVVYEGRELVKVSSGPYHYYSRVETFIDPGTGLPVRVDYHDRAGQHFREHLYEDVRTVDGHPFPHRQVVRDLLTRAHSEMTFRDVQIDPELDDEAFSARAVERRMRRTPDSGAPTQDAD